jgi:hypothetical protein
MLDRQQILDAIRECAEGNGGVPLGRRTFVQRTGIKASDVDRHWVRWSDAITDAGFLPNAMNTALEDDFVLGALADLTRRLGHYPVNNELRHHSARTPGFPNSKTIQNRYGDKQGTMRRLKEFCSTHQDYLDVLHLLPEATEVQQSTAAATAQSKGWVYLLKSGKHYKVGRTNDVFRRSSEIRLQLPDRMDLIHQIETDDPPGIERYWHERFADRRTNGEWFALTSADVSAFRRRRFM